MSSNGDDQFDIRKDVMALLTAIDVIDGKPPADERRRVLELMALMLQRMAIAVEDELHN